MNYRNLLQAVLFPLVLWAVDAFFVWIGFTPGGEISNQIAQLIVASLLTFFFGEIANRVKPTLFHSYR